MNNNKNQTLDDEVSQVFAEFDTNGDGKISSTELAAVLDGLGTATLVEEVERIMSEFDKDGDGFIDLNEFKAFRFAEASNKELREAFDLYDKDKNGKISAKELHAVLKALERSVRSRIIRR